MVAERIEWDKPSCTRCKMYRGKVMVLQKWTRELTFQPR